ncbi:MAG: hypothetical protein KFB93_01685 [Simkaniaceae bacterium]|jgi:hypothetical protein|nr:MAG: hypothetical protein KFB93_01685 [Simkaniaceae bacterium]
MKPLPFLLFFSTLFGVTINIHNDSIYTLNATIYSKTNIELTTVEIRPSHMITWSDSLFDAKDYSKGPFTIDFTCPNGDSYGTVSKVAQNTTIYAKRSRGRKKCGSDSQPKPHQDFEKNQPHWKY